LAVNLIENFIDFRPFSMKLAIEFSTKTSDFGFVGQALYIEWQTPGQSLFQRRALRGRAAEKEIKSADARVLQICQPYGLSVLLEIFSLFLLRLNCTHAS
jgi:hypothetical protein